MSQDRSSEVNFWPRWLTFLRTCKATSCMRRWPKQAHILIWTVLILSIFLLERNMLTVNYMASFYFVPLIYGVVFLSVWADLALISWGIGIIWIHDWGNVNILTIAMSASALVLLGGAAFFSRKLIKIVDREKALLEERERLNEHLVHAFAKTIEYKDEYTMGHSIRVAEYARGISQALDLATEYTERIYTAGLLHDVGKIGVREAILLKQGLLTNMERNLIQGHVELGVRILLGIPGFEDIVPMVADHHERWEGRGYPHNKAGEEITLGGRILAVADAFDAMTSKRVYREPVAQEDALAELIRCSGGQFEPKMVQAFIRMGLPSTGILSSGTASASLGSSDTTSVDSPSLAS